MVLVIDPRPLIRNTLPHNLEDVSLRLNNVGRGGLPSQQLIERETVRLADGLIRELDEHALDLGRPLVVDSTVANLRDELALALLADVFPDVGPLDEAHALFDSLEQQDVVVHVLGLDDDGDMVEVTLSELTLQVENGAMRMEEEEVAGLRVGKQVFLLDLVQFEVAVESDVKSFFAITIAASIAHYYDRLIYLLFWQTFNIDFLCH